MLCAIVLLCDRNMKNNLLRLKYLIEKLDQEGFKTSHNDPFWSWMHPEYHISECDTKPGNTLFVSDPCIPLLAPFDITVASLKIDKDIYYQLCFYYVNILEDQTDPLIINEIYSHHAEVWFRNTKDYLSDIANKHSLKWDTEHDAYIQDTLYGHFESEMQFLNILLEIKVRYEDRCDFLAQDALTWRSNYPEIDNNLKWYRDLWDVLIEKSSPLYAYQQFRCKRNIKIP